MVSPAGQVTPERIDELLWRSPDFPNVRILFAGRRPPSRPEIMPEHAQTVLTVLAEMAETVILDLPGAVVSTTWTALLSAGLVAVVADRDLLSVGAVARLLRIIREEPAFRARVAAVLVNRAALVSLMPIVEVERELGLELLGVIPPAGDECERAAAAGKPIVLADPESLYSTSVRDLAAGLLPLPVAATASLIAHR